MKFGYRNLGLRWAAAPNAALTIPVRECVRTCLRAIAVAFHTTQVTPMQRARPATPVRSDAALAMFLAEGGDERIKVNPLSGRTKYGTPSGPAPDEIWFSSSTASAIDRRGFAAAADALSAIMDDRKTEFLHPAAWFDRIRGRIIACFGVPGTKAILSASGTEAEFIALSIANAMTVRPLTNIIVAPTETGSGVINAAAGRHFLASSSLGGDVEAGAYLDGLQAADVKLEAIAIRDQYGRPRELDDIDSEAIASVGRALAGGRDVLLHVLDTSKTGLCGVTRQTARALRDRANGHMQVVVDACQLRCSPERIRADLDAGFMVMITGSKFAAGPPFAGALLLPPAVTDALGARPGVPAGLAAYSALLDWPPMLRKDFAAALGTPFNLGLGLRWDAALATIEPFFALPLSARAYICTWFAAEVRRHVAMRPHLRMAETSADGTIFPVVTKGAESAARAAALNEALAMTNAPGMPLKLARRCHVGQPVLIADEAALRICASMPLVLDIAAYMDEGRTIESAPVADDLDFLFRKWDRLAGF